MHIECGFAKHSGRDSDAEALRVPWTFRCTPLSNQTTNATDCGVFALAYMDIVCADLNTDKVGLVTQASINVLRSYYSAVLGDQAKLKWLVNTPTAQEAKYLWQELPDRKNQDVFIRIQPCPSGNIHDGGELSSDDEVDVAKDALQQGKVRCGRALPAAPAAWLLCALT